MGSKCCKDGSACSNDDENCANKCSDDSDVCSPSGCGGGGCCGGPRETIDISSLGKEAVEMDNMFKDVNTHLSNALKSRRSILEALHAYSKDEVLKAKMDKVLSAQHPVLIQFVLGMMSE
ncbi:hypothetical protein HY990_02125 [Candidatus Micrarchaeota archaeon]|nr:hypothetical protein [Candidatus Micrarchaeota archaeon]